MDWDNDGLHDLLIGDAEGRVTVFLNEKQNNFLLLKSVLPVHARDGVLDVGDRATPVAEDWNSDGKKDLIVGSMDGKIYIFLNTGSDAEPRFDHPHHFLSAGSELISSSRTAPRIYDWNHDGLKDLLVGEIAGYVYYLKNVGTGDKPLFTKAEKLFLRNGEILQYPDQSGSPRSRVFVTDWNNDGLDDLLLGGRDGKVMLFLAAEEPSRSPVVFIKRTLHFIKEIIIAIKSDMKKILKV
ncbi:VCBS repeat-containing protein [bacterium]|nr:MAG: VCBS repeat-containing protein [bacterium]